MISPRSGYPGIFLLQLNSAPGAFPFNPRVYVVRARSHHRARQLAATHVSGSYGTHLAVLWRNASLSSCRCIGTAYEIAEAVLCVSAEDSPHV